MNKWWKHAYSVISVDPKAKTLKLRNPWGQYGRTLEGEAIKEGDGTVDIKLVDFMKWFDTVSYSGQVKKINE